MAHTSDQDGEIRFDPLMARWVIMAPQRGRRPKDRTAPEEGRHAVTAHDRRCPFCPANEAHLSEILLQTGGPEGWATRVVANKYPALVPQTDLRQWHEGPYRKTNAFGRHEVVIESPHHDRQPAGMTLVEVESLVETYRRRYNDLVRMDDDALVLIFRNHGWRAGTSLAHPHSQIVATALGLQRVMRREAAAQRYHDEKRACLLCDILAYEIGHGARLLWENESFAALVPYAANVPCEIWIVPRRHQADFGRIGKRGQTAFASALQRALKRLDEKLEDPDYNYMIHSARRKHADAPHLHWYLRIAPRLTTRAGFEIGSGISINPSLPEDDAAFLREG